MMTNLNPWEVLVRDMVSANLKGPSDVEAVLRRMKDMVEVADSASEYRLPPGLTRLGGIKHLRDSYSLSFTEAVALYERLTS